MQGRLVLSVAIVLCSSLTPSANAQNWPQFRGPHASGLSDQGTHPETWSNQERVAWKVAIPGIGWSQPIVWGNHVFVTSAVAEKQQRPKPGEWSPGDGIGGLSFFVGSVRKPPDVKYRWQLFCLDLTTGSVLWEQTPHTGKPRIPVHPNNTYATETPVTDGERVIAYFGPAGVYCYDFSGKQLWGKDLGTYSIQMDWGTASSPILFGDSVFVQCDNDTKSFLLALDKRTGEERWRADRDEKSNWCTPVIWKTKDRTELITAGGNRMRSYDPATGKLLWEMKGSGRCSSSPVAGEQYLFVNSADRMTGQRGILAAIRPGALQDISLKDKSTTNEFVVWSENVSGGRVASPLQVGNCLYLFEQTLGIVRCLDSQTGKQHYRVRIPDAAGITASPWTNGGKIYCLDQSGQTFAIAVGADFNVVAKNNLAGELFWSSPALAGDSLLIRSIDDLYCIR